MAMTWAVAGNGQPHRGPAIVQIDHAPEPAVVSAGERAIGTQELNVLIGPNGSGKSNLLEAISLLPATATDLRPVLSRGGGVAEWIWKGNPNEAAVIDVAVFALFRNEPITTCYSHFVPRTSRMDLRTNSSNPERSTERRQREALVLIQRRPSLHRRWPKAMALLVRTVPIKPDRFKPIFRFSRNATIRRTIRKYRA